MDFEWDEAKSRRNDESRGLPFDLAFEMFLGDTVEGIDDRREYGELRRESLFPSHGTDVKGETGSTLLILEHDSAI